MRKAELAEWLLSLVVSPDRASSTVGDLLDMSSGRSGWFAYAVGQTLFASIARQVRTDAPRLATIAGLGMVASIVSTLVSVMVVSVVLVLVAGSAYSAGLRILEYRQIGWVVPIFAIVFIVSLAFHIGRWMARECPGREMAVCIAFVLLQGGLELIASLIGGPLYIANSTPALLFDLPVLIGVILERRRYVGMLMKPA